MKTINKILALLAPPERKRARVLMIMILIMAILDMLGVASILPFIAVLGNPDLVQDNVVLNTLFTASKYMGVQQCRAIFLCTRGSGIFTTHYFDNVQGAYCIFSNSLRLNVRI